MKIKHLSAIEILDSRGNPTIETTVELENGVSSKASVPSGASTGSYEAFELRDNDPKRFEGKGVLKAVDQVNNTIARHLKNSAIEALEDLDQKMIELDGTEKKSNLGANAILSVSLAAARTLSAFKHEPLWKTVHDYFFYEIKPSLPRLMVNIVNGGKHANWNFDIQEFIIIPQTNISHDALRIASEIFHSLEHILKEHMLEIAKGDEGGYSPHLSSNEEVFDYIKKAAAKAGYPDGELQYGIDAAASEFCKQDIYTLSKGGRTCNRAELTEFYEALMQKDSIYSFEDPFSEDDWVGFKNFTAQFGHSHLIVGDDLYTTNTKRIKRGIEEKATNAVLIKPNQIGTLSQTCQAITLSQDAGMKIVVSHRSGETEDSFIADLAVACGADFLKAGSMSRSERLAKYNRLIEIEKNEWVI